MGASHVIRATDFSFDPPAELYRGKVRDVYRRGDQLLMVATDRISAFDHVLPRPIPRKGEILNRIATRFLKATRDICPNWLEATPDPNVSLGKACEPIPIEMVIRRYLVGHAWREYSAGKRVLCGVPLPEGMREADAFPTPIITPATKAEEGHDEDISREEILRQGIVTEDVYLQLEDFTYRLFQRGTAMAAERGLLLVDTKYEFGWLDGKVYLIDEIHTPDSSRYFFAAGYAERQLHGERQRQLSKEFVREWLMEQGFQGKSGQQMPDMPDSFVSQVTKRYAELFQLITGEALPAAPPENPEQRIAANLASTSWRL